MDTFDKDEALHELGTFYERLDYFIDEYADCSKKLKDALDEAAINIAYAMDVLKDIECEDEE
jgi:hypothetical protein